MGNNVLAAEGEHYAEIKRFEMYAPGAAFGN